MDKISREREQKIGKQLMIIRMMYDMENTLRKTGFSMPSLTSNNITKWARFEKEEYDLLVKYFKKLDLFNIALDAAKKYSEDKTQLYFDIYLVAFNTLKDVVLLIDEEHKERYLTQVKDSIEEQIYEHRYMVDNNFFSMEKIEELYSFLLSIVTDNIMEANKKGLDFLVIQEILQTPVHKDFFLALEKTVEVNIHD